MKKFYFLVVVLSILFLAECAKAPLQPEHQFVKIQFHYGFRNELDTFEGTFQKDLILDGTIKTSFRLDAEEQDLILAQVVAIGFFQYPDTIMWKGGPDSIHTEVEPNPGWQFLRIRYEDEEKAVYWRYPLPEEDKLVAPLLDVTHLLREVIESKPEYQALPPARGGYL